MERLVDQTIGLAQFADTTDKPLPESARTIIIGGGIIGASVAYHLAEAGETDVLVLEANTLGSGTTWHAAGLVSSARATAVLTELAKYSRDFYETLEARSGIDVNWVNSRSMSIARTDGRVDELQAQYNVTRQAGIACELVDAEGARAHWPLLSTEGVLGGLVMHEDGNLNPGYAGIALAKLAHERGVEFRENVRVTELIAADGTITGVRTEQREIQAERVVLAAGLWSRTLGKTVGAHLPLYAAEHVHVRSHPVDGVGPDLPVLRDLDASYYIRHEEGRLLVGAFEPDGLPRAESDISTNGFAEFDPDWEHFSSVRRQAEHAVPALLDAGFERFLNAPESFTPDANFLLGETGEIRKLFTAAGMNSQGIIYAPGVGRELAAWIIAGAPQFDASSVDVRRFSRNQANRRYLHERTREGLGRLYAMHWPHLEMTTGRGMRRTPLHGRLEALGAAFGELNGWERANWYAEPGATPELGYSYRRPSWFENVAAEHRAVREAVGLFDLSPFAKFEVVGRDALEVVQRVFTANLDVESHTAVYTLQLTETGGIALDCTVTRLGDDRFLVVAPSATLEKTKSILTRAAEGTGAVVFDATAAYATILVSGPRSRELLQRVSPEDWSDAAQPYLRGREVEIADGYAYALRVSFVGELGYELYVSSDLAVNVFDALWEAGQDLGLRLAGYHALDSLRVEKGFRHLGHDIGPADDPRSAGLWFTVDLAKGDFIGRDAIADSTPSSRKHRTVYFKVEDPAPVLVHDETLFRDGEQVGHALSGAYGHTLGGAVGLAAIGPHVDVDPGAWEIECGAERYPVSVSKRPLYDPSGSRMRD